MIDQREPINGINGGSGVRVESALATASPPPSGTKQTVPTHQRSIESKARADQQGRRKDRGLAHGLGRRDRVSAASSSTMVDANLSDQLELADGESGAAAVSVVVGKRKTAADPAKLADADAAAPTPTPAKLADSADADKDALKPSTKLQHDNDYGTYPPLPNPRSPPSGSRHLD